MGVQPIGCGPSPHRGLWPATKQQYAAMVCHLMVSTPVIHVLQGCNYMDYYSFTGPGWMSWPGWLTQNSLPMKWSPVNHRSWISQPAKDRQPNHWAMLPSGNWTHNVATTSQTTWLLRHRAKHNFHNCTCRTKPISASVQTALHKFDNHHFYHYDQQRVQLSDTFQVFLIVLADFSLILCTSVFVHSCTSYVINYNYKTKQKLW